MRGGFGIFDVLPLPYEFGLNTAATAPFQIIGLDPNSMLGSGIDPNISFNPNKIRNRYVDQNPHRADRAELEFQHSATTWLELDVDCRLCGLPICTSFGRRG